MIGLTSLAVRVAKTSMPPPPRARWRVRGSGSELKGVEFGVRGPNPKPRDLGEVRKGAPRWFPEALGFGQSEPRRLFPYGIASLSSEFLDLISSQNRDRFDLAGGASGKNECGGSRVRWVWAI